PTTRRSNWMTCKRKWTASSPRSSRTSRSSSSRTCGPALASVGADRVDGVGAVREDQEATDQGVPAETDRRSSTQRKLKVLTNELSLKRKRSVSEQTLRLRFRLGCLRSDSPARSHHAFTPFPRPWSLRELPDGCRPRRRVAAVPRSERLGNGCGSE